MAKLKDKSVTEDLRYHNTWLLLQKYRDVTWSLELSVQNIRTKFQTELGSSIEDFLDSIYVAGVDFKENGIQGHAQNIEQSCQMLKLLNAAIQLLRSRHKFGEAYYWILYYTYLSPHQSQNADEIVELLHPHIRDISYRTYYRRRKEAIEALSSVLWGYSSRDSLKLLQDLFPDSI